MKKPIPSVRVVPVACGIDNEPEMVELRKAGKVFFAKTFLGRLR